MNTVFVEGLGFLVAYTIAALAIAYVGEQIVAAIERGEK